MYSRSKVEDILGAVEDVLVKVNQKLDEADSIISDLETP